MVLKSSFFVLGLLLLFLPGIGHAAGDKEFPDSLKTEKVLLLVKKRNSRIKFIQIGAKVKVGLRNQFASKKGILEAVSDSGVVISGGFYKMNDLDWIRARTVGIQPVQAGGVVMLASGTVSTGAGLWLAIAGARSGDVCCAGIGIVGGAALIALGVMMAVPGGLMLALPPKYDLKGKWIPQMGQRVLED